MYACVIIYFVSDNIVLGRVPDRNAQVMDYDNFHCGNIHYRNKTKGVGIMNRMVKVELIGNCAEINTDYNGKRYCFLRGKIYDVPIEVYQEIILSQHVHSRNIVPVQIDTKMLEDENRLLKETNAQLLEENSRLKKEVKDAVSQSKKTRSARNNSASAGD